MRGRSGKERGGERREEKGGPSEGDEARGRDGTCDTLRGKRRGEEKGKECSRKREARQGK